VQAFFNPLPVRKLLWVGRKTEARLKAMGINTIGDLANSDMGTLTGLFGVAGTQMWLMAHGIDRGEVEERVGVKSVSHESTFEEDTTDPATVLAALDGLSEEVSKEAIAQHLYFKTVTVKLRYANFETHTRSKTLRYMTNRPQDLKKAARELLLPCLEPNRKVRLLGVRVSNFVSAERQKTLI
jgi:nucleotidyltransferase/DNA polymerase involved in DNA repair